MSRKNIQDYTRNIGRFGDWIDMDAQIAMSLLILIIFGFPMLAVFIVMIFDSMGSKKSKFLFFESPSHARMINANVKDQKVKVGRRNSISAKQKSSY